MVGVVKIKSKQNPWFTFLLDQGGVLFHFTPQSKFPIFLVVSHIIVTECVILRCEVWRKNVLKSVHHAKFHGSTTLHHRGEVKSWGWKTASINVKGVRKRVCAELQGCEWGVGRVKGGERFRSWRGMYTGLNIGLNLLFRVVVLQNAAKH